MNAKTLAIDQWVMAHRDEIVDKSPAVVAKQMKAAGLYSPKTSICDIVHALENRLEKIVEPFGDFRNLWNAVGHYFIDTTHRPEPIALRSDIVKVELMRTFCWQDTFDTSNEKLKNEVVEYWSFGKVLKQFPHRLIIRLDDPRYDMSGITVRKQGKIQVDPEFYLDDIDFRLEARAFIRKLKEYDEGKQPSRRRFRGWSGAKTRWWRVTFGVGREKLVKMLDDSIREDEHRSGMTSFWAKYGLTPEQAIKRGLYRPNDEE